MKKLLSLALALIVFATAASACGNKEESSEAAPEKEAINYTKKEVNAYPLDEKKPLKFSCLFREDLPDIPYISAEDYFNQLFTEKVSVKKGENGTVTFTNGGFNMTMDAEKDTLSSDSIECFVMANHKAYADSAEADYIKEKGQDLLLKALHRVVYDFNIYNIRLHLIGKGDSESLLKKMVTDLQLDDFVIFEGLKSQDYIYNHLCDYDLFVQPSRQEGFGLTVAEALAAKLPVLVSDIEGPMEIIGYGKFGMHFKSEDVDDLAEKLRTVLQGGYDYTLVEKAYQHVCEDYDVANTARKYLEEYRKLI